MLMLALLLAQAAPDPTPEALALGRRLAETGTLAALLPAVVAKEREELVAEHPGWSEADKAALRETADKVARMTMERLMNATGRAYARRLSVEDLRVLVAFNEGPAARRWREATPAAVLESMASLGGLDFKGDVRRAFCAGSGERLRRDFGCQPR
jgi:hypothetical protein